MDKERDYIIDQIDVVKEEFRTADISNGHYIETLQQKLSCLHDDLASLAGYYRNEKENMPEVRKMNIDRTVVELIEGNKTKTQGLAEKKARSEHPFDDAAKAISDWSYIEKKLKSVEGMLTTMASILRSIDTQRRYMESGI